MLFSNTSPQVKVFKLKTCINLHYLVLHFYQINEDDEIRTRYFLVIEALILCQKI